MTVKLLRAGLSIFSIWLIAVLGALLLFGCNGRIPFSINNAPKLPSKVAGSSDKAVINLQKKLAKCGVKVVTIGENYLISIPAAALFPNQSPNLTWGSYAVLNTVASFLKQFHKVAINVTSYSSKYVSAKRERALTLARARMVADYLWSQGVDSRFIFTVGAGSDKPITRAAQDSDRSPNSRIEITFRDIII